ncbi:MAG: NAD(P)-dependent glycerol-1-phosphate dehydrogenase [Candidatus Bathyarchaeia archaeon]
MLLEADAALNSVHRIDLPRIVLVGWGVLGSLGKVFLELGLKRPLIVTGHTTLGIAGSRAEGHLRDLGLKPELELCTEADLETVERVREKAESMGADTVVGVGGGRTIDVAKLSAGKSGAFFISVPTTASHDGIASNLASVKGLGRPYSMKANPPIAVLADSQIISESPFRFTASGCGDVISKAVSVRDWRLAREEKNDYYGEYAGSLALLGSSLIMRNAEKIRGQTEEGYRTLLEALVSCGVSMSIAGSSRPCSGSAHLLSHALDMIAPGAALHGEQCGVGTIMMAKLHGLDWEKIRDSLAIIGAPTSAEGLGVDGETLVEALVKAGSIRPERYTILNKVNLTRESAGKLAESCGII